MASPRQKRLVPASVALPFPVELSRFTLNQKLEMYFSVEKVLVILEENNFLPFLETEIQLCCSVQHNLCRTKPEVSAQFPSPGICGGRWAHRKVLESLSLCIWCCWLLPLLNPNDTPGRPSPEWWFISLGLWGWMYFISEKAVVFPKGGESPGTSLPVHLK